MCFWGIELQEEDFGSWLLQRGAESGNGVNARVDAVRTIESSLEKLGSPHRDMQTAWQADRFEQLRQRLRELREDFEAGGTDYRNVMPLAERPAVQLSNWRSWLGQYGQFLSGEPLGNKDADRIRHYVLEHYIEAARANDVTEVSVRVKDVHQALGLRQAWATVCQAIAGQIFRQLADVEPPEQIGKVRASGDC